MGGLAAANNHGYYYGDEYALGGLAQAVRSGYQKVKGWAKSLAGWFGRKQPGLTKASSVIYPQCDLTHRSEGAVQFEDQD